METVSDAYSSGRFCMPACFFPAAADSASMACVDAALLAYAKKPKKPSRFVTGIAIFGTLFGLLTIVSGGAALFNATAQEMAGNIVGFVLWFNFLAGFAYVIAGAGLLASQRWAVWLSMAIAAATCRAFKVQT